jgi:hypothetical protein
MPYGSSLHLIRIFFLIQHDDIQWIKSLLAHEIFKIHALLNGETIPSTAPAGTKEACKRSNFEQLRLIQSTSCCKKL